MNEIFKSAKTNYKEVYGIDVGDLYYKYEEIGQLFWGMHKYTVKNIGTGCMCRTLFYVDLEFTNNENKKSSIHVNCEKLNQFSKTEVEAWRKYFNSLNKEITRLKELIEKTESEKIKINNKIKELINEQTN